MNPRTEQEMTDMGPVMFFFFRAYLSRRRRIVRRCQRCGSGCVLYVAVLWQVGNRRGRGGVGVISSHELAVLCPPCGRELHGLLDRSITRVVNDSTQKALS